MSNYLRGSSSHAGFVEPDPMKKNIKTAFRRDNKNLSHYTCSAAGFSRCRRYRYWLRRAWDPSLEHCVFICLNPSTADAHYDDPTLRRCVSMAGRWGFGSLLLVNLFSFRTTNPRALKTESDPIGPRTDLWLRRAARETPHLIVAWGNGGLLDNRGATVHKRLGTPFCLGVTALGMPRHPLYCPDNTRLTPLPALPVVD